jgi:hypothetical protein
LVILPTIFPFCANAAIKNKLKKANNIKCFTMLDLIRANLLSQC